MKFYMFRTVFLSIIMSFRAGPSWSFSKAIYKPVWHIPLLSVQWMNSWWWTEELSKTCRVSWQKNVVKLVHLVGCIIKKNRKSMFQFWKCNPCELSHFCNSVDKVPVLLRLSSHVTRYWFLMFPGDIAFVFNSWNVHFDPLRFNHHSVMKHHIPGEWRPLSATHFHMHHNP